MRWFSNSKLLLVLWILPLLLMGCGGRTINKNFAQELIVKIPGGRFDKESVDVQSVSQVGSKDAIVEARLRMAFRFEQVGSRWMVREVLIGSSDWESLPDLERALQLVKTEQTKDLLAKLAAAVEKYRDKNASLPEFQDYTELSDALYPGYMTALIRLDSWKNPLAAYRVGPTTIRLVSAGPDGQPGTADDIEMTRNFARDHS